MMIKSSSQVTLANGMQQISWWCDTNPTTATFTWEDGGPLTVPVTLDSSSGFYVATALVPAEVFFVKLNSEPRVMRYEGEWGEGGDGGDIALLEYEGGEDGYPWLFKVPYCDLSTIDLRFYTQTMVPLEIWGYSSRKKAWQLSDIYVDEEAYGGNTLIAILRTTGGLVRQQDGTNWVELVDLPGGFVVELVNHRRVTTDRIVNATICRDSLYGKTYQRSIPL